ncbi:MAG: TetR/AcrR family transcriptional regulator [Saprospiraceae bacterium]
MKIGDNILGAAFELFMKYGVRSVSMDDIANVLGVSKKTIYTKIDSKENLIKKVIRIHLLQDEKEIRKITNESTDAIDEIHAISKHVMQFLMQIKPSLIFDLKKYYPDCWTLIEGQHFSFIRETIQNNIVRGQNENLYRNDLDPFVIAKLYVAKSNTIVNQEIFPISEFDLISLMKQLENYHLHGIVSENGRKKLSSLSIYNS